VPERPENFIDSTFGFTRRISYIGSFTGRRHHPTLLIIFRSGIVGQGYKSKYIGGWYVFIMPGYKAFGSVAPRLRCPCCTRMSNRMNGPTHREALSIAVLIGRIIVGK